MDFRRVNETVIIFDEKNNGIRISEFIKGQSEIQSVFYPCKKEDSLSDFIDECLFTLKEIVAKNPPLNSQVSVVLPTRFIAGDFVTVPNLTKSQSLDALKTELSSIYSNYNDLEIRSETVNMTRNNVTFYVSIINRILLQKIHKTLAKIKLFPKNIMTSAVALANASLVLRPKIKHSNLLVIDIKENNSIVCFISQGKCFGGMELEFGDEVLSDKRVVPEYTIYNHNLANKIVYGLDALEQNAKINLALEASGENGEDLQSEKIDETANKDLSKIMETKMQWDRFLASKSLKKAQPETKEEILEENLNIFVKQLQNIALFIRKSNFVDEPNLALINNLKYPNLLHEQKQIEDDFAIANLSNDTETNLLENLEAVGAVAISNSNKNQIF